MSAQVILNLLKELGEKILNVWFAEHFISFLLFSR